jgi:hypothetical protein
MAALARCVADGLTPRLLTIDPEPYSGDRRLTVAGDVVAVLRACEVIRLSDKVAERKRPRLGWAAIAMFVGAFLSVPFGARTSWQLPLIAGFAAGFLVFVIWWNKVRKIDIEDRKLDVVLGTIATFAYELALKRCISVSVDFRDHAKTRATHAGDAEHFEHPWLDLAFTLADGTELQLEGTSHAKRKSRRKRKYTKIGERYHERLRVTLRPPRGHAFAVGTPALPPGVSPCDGLRLRGARLQPAAARFEFSTPDARRWRNRAGWGSSGTAGLLTRQKVVAAISCSYKLASQGVPRS